MSFKDIISNWIVKNILLAVAVAAVIIIAISQFLRAFTYHDKIIEAPVLTNMSVAQADSLAAAYGLRIQVTDSLFVKRMPHGYVYRQDPMEGSKVKKGRKIRLTINAMNAQKVIVPNVVGYSTRQAKAELQSRGLRVGRLIYQSDMASNNVLRQVYRGRNIRPGKSLDSDSAIDLVIGLNSSDNTTSVPKVIGLTGQAATSVVQDSYMNVKKLIFDESVHNYADSLSATVYRQTPQGGVVFMGSEMTLYLTTDPEKKAK